MTALNSTNAPPAEPQLIVAPEEDSTELILVKEIWEAGVDENPVHASLIEYERAKIPAASYGQESEVRLYLQNAEEEILGGAIATTRWCALNVLSLWLQEPLRGRGFGSTLMDELEEYAVATGCIRILLETTTMHSFEFYRHKGFELVGYIDGYPAGEQFFYLQKLIADSATCENDSAHGSHGA